LVITGPRIFYLQKLIKIKRSDGSTDSVTEKELKALNEKKKFKKQLFLIKKQRNRLLFSLVLSWLIFLALFFYSQLNLTEKNDKIEHTGDTTTPATLPLDTRDTTVTAARKNNREIIDTGDATGEAKVIATAHTDPSTPNPESSFDQQEIRQAIHQWAIAWSNRDHARYISAYSENFIPSNKRLTYKTWVTYRQERIKSPDWINVKIADINITPPGDNGLVITQFKQDYPARSPE